MGELKDAQATLRFKNSRFVQSPKFGDLRDVFTNVFDDKTYFAFFSDDSILTLRCSDGVYRCNLDISSCDMSHGPHLFRVVRHLLDGTLHETSLHGVVDQLMKPLTVKSTQDRRRKCTLKPNTPVLLSGSTITTFINNLASFLIYSEIISRAPPTLANAEGFIREAAERAGYIVTCDRIVEPEDAQFLKHSPTYTETGEIHPTLNLGVILRALGTCHRDLPGRKKMTPEARAYSFNSSLVTAFKHAGDHALMRVLRRKFSAGGKILATQSSYFLDELDDSPDARLDENSLLRRYRLPLEAFLELCSLIASCPFGGMIHCVASRAILAKDYGL
jgi:hypothetical protein